MVVDSLKALDPNRPIREADIARVMQIPLPVTDRIVASRPYYALLDLRQFFAGNPDRFGRLMTFFAAPICYADKVTGKEVRLVPDRSRILVRFAEGQTESASDVGRPLKLSLLTKHSGRPQTYAIYEPAR